MTAVNQLDYDHDASSMQSRAVLYPPLFIHDRISLSSPYPLFLPSYTVYVFSHNSLLSVDINYRTYLPALRGVVVVVHVFSDNSLCCHLPFAAAFALSRRQRKCIVVRFITPAVSGLYMMRELLTASKQKFKRSLIFPWKNQICCGEQ